MMQLFEYIGNNVVYLLSLWADKNVAKMIGANFLYIMLSIWIVWCVVNIFVIRPMDATLGGLYTDHVRAHNREARYNASRLDRDARESARRQERESYAYYKANRSRGEAYSARYNADKRHDGGK